MTSTSDGMSFRELDLYLLIPLNLAAFTKKASTFGIIICNGDIQNMLFLLICNPSKLTQFGQDVKLNSCCLCGPLRDDGCARAPIAAVIHTAADVCPRVEYTHQHVTPSNLASVALNHTIYTPLCFCLTHSHRRHEILRAYFMSA